MQKTFRRISLLLSLLITNSVFAESTYDWTGFYLGGFVGGASSAQTNTSEPDTPTFGSWYFPGTSPYNYRTGSGFIGGGTLGYNWQFDGTPYLVGLEAEYGYLGLGGSTADPNSADFNAAFPSNTPSSAKSSTNVGGQYGYGFIGDRIGYSLERTLFFIKSGAVFTSTQTTFSDPAQEQSLNMSTKSNKAGFALGGGVEYALPYTWAEDLSVKVEYLYLGINRTQTATGVDTLNGDTYTSTSHISGIHTAKVGVNLKF